MRRYSRFPTMLPLLAFSAACAALCPSRVAGDQWLPVDSEREAAGMSLKNTEAYGVMLLNAGQYDQAAIEFMKVLAVNPDNEQAEANLRKAQAGLDAASGKNTEKARLQNWYKEGVAALNAGQAAEAVEYFEAILTVRPGHEPSLIRLAKAREMLQAKPPVHGAAALKSPPAKPAARPVPPKKAAPKPPVARVLNKREMEAIYARGVAMYNDARYKECMAEFEKILSVNPAHAPSRLRYDKARLALKRRP